MHFNLIDLKKKWLVYFFCICLLTIPVETNAFNIPANMSELISLMSATELKINPQQQEDEEISIDIEGVMGNTPFKISGNLSKLAHAFRPELTSSVYLTIETAVRED